jgi:hypothetical protein
VVDSRRLLLGGQFSYNAYDFASLYIGASVRPLSMNLKARPWLPPKLLHQGPDEMSRIKTSLIPIPDIVEQITRANGCDLWPVDSGITW